MKKRILFIAMTFSLIVTGQKIKVNEVDKFTKQHVIETSFEKIVSDNNLMGSTGGRLMKNIWVGIKQVGDKNYLRIKWCSNQVLALGEGAHIILLDKDGNTYKFENTTFTVAGLGEGTVGFAGSAIYGLNIYFTGDLSALINKEITDMRIHTTEGYIDFAVSKNKTGIFGELYNIVKQAN